MINPAESIAGGQSATLEIESVADILERQLDSVIQDWLSRVEKESELTCIPLSFEDRTGHLPLLLRAVASGRSNKSSDLAGRRYPRRSAAQARLHSCYGGGGIASTSGQYFFVAAQRGEAIGI